MGKLRMASIFAACFGMAVLFCNFTPLALPVESADTDISEIVAKTIGSAMNMAPSLKNGCTNDLVETNAVHVKNEKGSVKVTLATGVPIHCGRPLDLKNVTVQSEPETDLRQPSSVNDLSLENFDGATILPAVKGTAVHFDNQSTISQISVAQQINDHTIIGSAHVNHDGKRAHIKEAHLTVYQNALHLIGKSHIKDLVFNDSCCTPVGGSITTQLTSGSRVAPMEAAAALVGKSETLTFDGCGSAQLRDSAGHRSQIPIQCL